MIVSEIVFWFIFVVLFMLVMLYTVDSNRCQEEEEVPTAWQ